MSKFGIVENNFLLIPRFYSCFIHYPSFAFYFSSRIFFTLKKHFYTKYVFFVMSYSIDVASALSYLFRVPRSKKRATLNSISG